MSGMLVLRRVLSVAFCFASTLVFVDHALAARPGEEAMIDQAGIATGRTSRASPSRIAPRPAAEWAGKEALLTTQLTPEDLASVTDYLSKYGKQPYKESEAGFDYESPWYEGLFRETGVLPRSLKGGGGWIKELDAVHVADHTSRITAVRGRTRVFRLEELYRDDDLFARYRRIGKDLASVRVKVVDDPKDNSFGMYVRVNGARRPGEITINIAALRKDRAADPNSPDTPLSVLAHEIQHMLDHLDGYGKVDEFRCDVSGYREGKPLAERRRIPPNQLLERHRSGYLANDVSYSRRRVVGTQPAIVPTAVRLEKHVVHGLLTLRVDPVRSSSVLAAIRPPPPASASR